MDCDADYPRASCVALQGWFLAPRAVMLRFGVAEHRAYLFGQLQTIGTGWQEDPNVGFGSKADIGGLSSRANPNPLNDTLPDGSPF